MQAYYLTEDWVEPFTLRFEKGNVLALYFDYGPKGPCGQSMSITCPHTVLHWFKDEDEFRYFVDNNDLHRNGVKAEIRHVVIGDYGCPGQFNVIKHDASTK